MIVGTEEYFTKKVNSFTFFVGKVDKMELL